MMPENDDAAIAAMAEDAFLESAGSHCDCCRKRPFVDGYIRGYKKGQLDGHNEGYKTGFEDGYIYAHGPHLERPNRAGKQSVAATEQPKTTESATDEPDNSSGKPDA